MYAPSTEEWLVNDWHVPPNSNPELGTIQSSRATARGKFFFFGRQKFYVKGVTYGAFQPNADGVEFHDLAKIEMDFRKMASRGINTVRIPHTTPPRYVLDIAARHGLKVMVGLSAEQYIGYLIDKKKKPVDIDGIIKEKLEACIGHPALLCIAVGNEIPSDLVRWIGKKKIERYIRRIFDIVKQEDPEALVTYVNYPTTEYLQLPFLDIVSFNVYLEDEGNLKAYLARLQNISGDRPLLLSEVGLDTIRNGENSQSKVLAWQINTIFSAGCAGLFVFSWTDEWFRGGEVVHDWAFGLTDRDRNPKPALASVTNAFSRIPVRSDTIEPLISVVVCTHNGQLTIRECLSGLLELEYKNFEVIVINDGSNDDTLGIIKEFPFKVVTTAPIGLSRARNLGMELAEGEIVAYIDDDAYPDPQWLTYLANAFRKSDYAAIGGPNLLPGDATLISECVDHTPGTPTHVLLSDLEAEHIPGCNMAFRKEHLKRIRGFDPTFRTAGDDVDICWRLQDLGLKIGFCHAAQVWHHRRRTVKAFWKQQVGYGKAEALLERKWPEKYNAFGHRTWGGMIYGRGYLPSFLSNRWRIYYGTWGSAPFQSIYEPGNGRLSFTLMPEWYILSGILVTLSIVGLFLKPLLLLLPFTLLVLALPVVHIIHCVNRFRPSRASARSVFYRIKFKTITTWLHIIQPLARLIGRFHHDLTPWRKFSGRRWGPVLTKKESIWCERWVPLIFRLETLEYELRQKNAYIKRGGIFDSWDLWIKGGAFGGVRLRMAAEDHAQGKQYLRFKIIPQWTSMSRYILIFLSMFIAISAVLKDWYSVATFCGVTLLFLVRTLSDCAIASGSSVEAIKNQTTVTGKGE